MLTQIHHKQNELFEVEFFKDKECTQLITDWSGYENAEIYIELQNGEIIPLLMLPTEISIYTPYIPEEIKEQLLAIFEKDYSSLYTLDDITPNLSKYIQEDSTVLFLTQEDWDKYANKILEVHRCTLFDDSNMKICKDVGIKKITIFLQHITQETIQKANDVAKELQEKYGVVEVNLFGLHCFVKRIMCGRVGYLCDKSEYRLSIKNNFIMQNIYCQDVNKLSKLNKDYTKEFIYYEYNTLDGDFAEYINKIITTNSTDILEPQNNGRLQVIDCFDILKDYLKENN